MPNPKYGITVEAKIAIVRRPCCAAGWPHRTHGISPLSIRRPEKAVWVAARACEESLPWHGCPDAAYGMHAQFYRERGLLVALHAAPTRATGACMSIYCCHYSSSSCMTRVSPTATLLLASCTIASMVPSFPTSLVAALNHAATEPPLSTPPQLLFVILLSSHC
jgi:hypothetical protein